MGETVGREERRSIGILYFLIIISVNLKLIFFLESLLISSLTPKMSHPFNCCSFVHNKHLHLSG